MIEICKWMLLVTLPHILKPAAELWRQTRFPWNYTYINQTFMAKEVSRQWHFETNPHNTFSVFRETH